jgi:hypothetical protein
MIPSIDLDVKMKYNSNNCSCFQAKNLDLNPLFLMLPATVSASFAFMLPVATPPNAIVFSYGHIRIRDMVRMVTGRLSPVSWQRSLWSAKKANL